MLLPYSVASVQRQTIQDIEIFIIGDGVFDETRKVILELQARDARIKFFDHPKHERRGEIYRHMALQEAKGEIVCYLCDRDLMLPDHIETHYERCKDHNFSSSMFIRVLKSSFLRLDHYFSYVGSAAEQDQGVIMRTGGLSMVSHTLEFYKALPKGWTTTPADQPTDAFMWVQFMRHKDCKAYSHPKATILYLKRDKHPGWSSEKRLPELKYWSNFLKGANEIQWAKDSALIGLVNEADVKRKKRAELGISRRSEIIFHFKRAIHLLLKSLRK